MENYDPLEIMICLSFLLIIKKNFFIFFSIEFLNILYDKFFLLLFFSTIHFFFFINNNFILIIYNYQHIYTHIYMYMNLI